MCSSPVVVLNINSKKYFTTHTKKRMNQKEKKNLKLIKFRLNMNSVIFALIWFSSCRRRVHFAINLRSLYLCLAIFFSSLFLSHAGLVLRAYEGTSVEMYVFCLCLTTTKNIYFAEETWKLNIKTKSRQSMFF